MNLPRVTLSNVQSTILAFVYIYLTSQVSHSAPHEFTNSSISNISLQHKNACSLSEFQSTRLTNASFLSVATLGLGIALIGLLSNGVVVFTFMMTKSLQTPSNVLLVNLAIGDMFFCSFGYAAQVMLDFSPYLYCNSNYMFAKTFFIKMSIFQAIFNITAIAVERFLAIDFPFLYQAHVTSVRLIVIAVTSWVVIACLAFATTYVQLYIGKHLLDVSIIATLCIMIVVIYSRVYMVSRRHIKRDRVHGINNKQCKSQAAVIIAALFILSWIPSVIFRLVAVSVTAKSYMNQMTYIGPLFGTWFNILVFTYRMKHFRRAVSELFGKHSVSHSDSIPTFT